jgi:hypothetical protein
MGLAYGPRSFPKTKAFQAVREKHKAEVSKKLIAKTAKTAMSQVTPSKAVPPRKIGIVKMVWPRVKLRPQGTSEIELALIMLVVVSKKTCLLDAPSSSHGRHDDGLAATKADEHVAHVAAFNNMGDDSSPNIRVAPLPQEIQEERLPPPPLMSG